MKLGVLNFTLAHVLAPVVALVLAVAASQAGAAISKRAREITPVGPALTDCRKVCGDIRAQIKSHPKSVAAEFDLWKSRLAVKGETVTYLRGLSAAEGLLEFMSTYYSEKAPEKQMETPFLAYLMGKCFPESYEDVDHAHLSGLVNTLWAARNLKIEKNVSSCR